MSIFFYNAFLLLYSLAIRVSSLWNPKAKNWRDGRKTIFEKIHSKIRVESGRKVSKLIWIHCASLGEFEQGRPIIEKIRAQNKGHRVLLTFFSPSGYEVKKNYPGADYIFYLPMDSKINAKRFLDLVNPSLVIFVKYDYWYYYLSEIKKRKINCLLISAVFRKEQAFFMWYGRLQRKMLNCFTEIFVQNEESKKLLETIKITNCTVSGDTRFDSVTAIAQNFTLVPFIKEFIANKKCIVAGSTWREDEEIIDRYTREHNDKDDYKWIIAPHEITHQHLSHLKKLFTRSIFYSELRADNLPTQADLLIIDNIGMLSRLYYYATVVYIGGGFGKKGVHNVLEAAVYGKPIIFGPVYHQFLEAEELVACKAAISISNYEEFDVNIGSVASSKESISEMSRKSEGYVNSNKGATEIIRHYIEENRLLTS